MPWQHFGRCGTSTQKGLCFCSSLGSLKTAETVKLDAIADQVYRELSKGLPYSKIATHLRVDSRRVRRLKQVWDGLPEFVREDHRKVWARTQRRQANVLEVGRDIGHRQVLLRRTSVAD